MKQRLSKLALLAVAAAFIVAGFPACSGEEEPEPPAQATATFTGVDIPEAGLALTAGVAKEVTATLTVANTAFSVAVKELEVGAPLADYITLTAGEKVSVDAKLKEKVEGNIMKITLTVTADSGAEKTGNITATLNAPAVMVSKDVEATGTISYTVTPNAQRPDPQPGEPVATLKGSGVSLTIDEEGTATATVTLENAKFAAEITADSFAVTAGDNVSVTVTKAEKKSDTETTLTLSVTAADGAEAGSIGVTVKAGAVEGYSKAIGATGSVGYTVKEADKPNQPTSDPKATLAGEAIEVTAGGDAAEATARVTLTDGTFAAAIAAGNFAATAGDNVSVMVTNAARTSDTVATLTLSVTAEDGAKAGNIRVTVNAGAVADYGKAIAATGAVAYTVKEAAKPEEPVYFTSFVASEDLGKTTDSSPYETLTSKDGLVTMGRSKYQSNSYATADYDEEKGTGYTYTARVKVNKTSGSDIGALTIKSVKIGAILRIDGGNGNDDIRTMKITGADETTWEAAYKTFGSIYLTATAETVVLESMTNEFCIYGIHVVDKKVAESVVGEPKMTYANPTLELSATSVVKGDEVTVTATIPDATKTTTYSTGRVTSETVPVKEGITYSGAAVTDGKVVTSEEGTFTITASYTIDGNEYKSEAVTLEVTGSFENKTENIPNTEEKLGLVATGVTSADESVATATLDGTKANIVITSKKAGTTTITASAGENIAKIVVTVSADGKITTTIKPYSSITADSWTITSDLYSKIQTPPEGTADAAGNFVVQGASDVLTATFYKSGSKGHGKTATSNTVTYGGYGSWASTPAISGGKFKNDFLKIADIKGSVTLTVEWAMNSKQTKDNRYLEVTVGEDKTKCVKTGCNDAKGKQPAYTVSFDAGEGTNVYIGTSNEICLVSVTIEAQK